MKKRILQFLLAAAMVLLMIPTVAFAAESTPHSVFFDYAVYGMGAKVSGDEKSSVTIGFTYSVHIPLLVDNETIETGYEVKTFYFDEESGVTYTISLPSTETRFLLNPGAVTLKKDDSSITAGSDETAVKYYGVDSSPNYRVELCGSVAEWNNVTYKTRFADSVSGYLQGNVQPNTSPINMDLWMMDDGAWSGQISVYDTITVQLAKYDGDGNEFSGYEPRYMIYTQDNNQSIFNIALTRSATEDFTYYVDVTPKAELVAVELSLVDGKGTALSGQATTLKGVDADGNPIAVSILNEKGEYPFTTEDSSTTVYLPVGAYTWSADGVDTNAYAVTGGSFTVVNSGGVLAASGDGVENNKVTMTMAELYTVSCAGSTNGTVSADKNTAAEGDTVTLTVTPDSDYKLDTLTVTDASGSEVKVEDNKFTMPGSNVTVAATFGEAITTVNVWRSAALGFRS